MGRELVERDDGAWWIVETVTDPKMRISRVFATKAEGVHPDVRRHAHPHRDLGGPDQRRDDVISSGPRSIPLSRRISIVILYNMCV